ncbi:PAS domain-containing protein [Archangium violaceum]|uniref:PAS domain-containing protein n=1 Tax=Archangium violaceum TaxID=83451 RepID=UPI00194DEC72|nr:PAS domain-containing protein [Archangium violaceum]QRN96190.1 PAS domain-containing protein [Archangium violaceum]
MNSTERRVTDVHTLLSKTLSHPDGESTFRQLAEAIPQLVWTTRPDGYHDYFNQRWYDYTGSSLEVTQGDGWRLPFHPEDVPEAQKRWLHSLRTGDTYEVEYRCRRHDGVYRWFLGRAQPVRDADGRIVKWFGTCTDIDEQKRAADSMRFLTQADSLLASSLDYETTLAALTRLAVPQMADWCSIDIQGEDGVVRLLAVAHVDPSKAKWAHELRRRYPPDPKDPHGIHEVIRTGRSSVLPDIPDSLLVAACRDKEQLRIARELGLRSSLTVPLTARGRTFGALALVTAESGRRFTPSDVVFAEQLASRAALAVDNARLYGNALRAEERFRSLVSASAQAVWVRRPDGLVEEDSPSWRAFTGQSYEDYRGHGWLAAIHPEDQERVRRGWEAARALKQPYEVEMRVRLPDGRYAITVCRAVPLLNPEGTVREWIGTTTDITAQRRAEESSRRLESEQRARQLESLRIKVSEVLSREEAPSRLMQDCAGAMVRSLPALALVQVWGWSREAQALVLEGTAGVAVPSSIQPTRLALGEGFVGTVGQTRQPLLLNDVLQHPGVRSREWMQAQGLVSFVGTPLLVRGQLVGVLSVFGRSPLEEEALATLATVADAVAQGLERRRAELSLQEHARELARSNEELQQFAYVASHDLQEPLRMVASYTQLLARRYQGKLDSDADEFIAYAVDGVNRMQRLIQDLLAYSRVGTRGHEFKPIDSGRALEKALANLKTLVEETEATLVQGKLPPVMADETQLIQLFQNLVGNALKFRGKTPPRVLVEAEREGNEWRFTVEDNGIGIEPQYYERIFVIFQRLHGKEEYPGTGIGLAICKKIVERHGGRIGLDSQLGQGTTFWFTLPAIPTPSPQGTTS